MTGIHFLFWIQKKSEGSVTLYYELYLDSLFFTDFIMNFYLLGLTKCILGRSATRLRQFAGAAYGAGIYCLTFLMPTGCPIGKILLGLVFSGMGMAVITFLPKHFFQIGKILLAMTGATFFQGGIYLFLKNNIPFKNYSGGIFEGMLFGGIAYGAGCFLLKKCKRKNTQCCQVLLQGPKEKLKVEALIDTGNSLMDPISKRPVSVLDEKILRNLYGGQLPEYYRVVPFCSIGKKNGLLKCFEIPKIWVVCQENEIICEKVLIACSEDFSPGEGMRMLVHPQLIKNLEEREYDIKGSDAWKNSV